MREQNQEKTYIAIDLKSFYASCECMERGLDPMQTNLVVADASRTEKTICLAVSPPLKARGVPGRPRLFEVVQKVREINAQRSRMLQGVPLEGSSVNDEELQAHPEIAVDYIVAKPQMAHYMERSRQIYDIYLQYVAPEDIFAYSVDEVFIDATDYLHTYKMDGHALAQTMIAHVFKDTGITATAGIGTNLYLAKIAMDIWAKHICADENGVRIAQLDERSYREQLWSHRPLTDFWRVGKGYAKKLEEHGLFTMGDIARCSIGTEQDYLNEELLYKLFGVNAELLIDHAWGYESATIREIKAYKPMTNSLSSGQVLQCPYETKAARLVCWEMTDLLVLELVEKKLVCDQLVLDVGYDIDNLKGDARFQGEVKSDRYGRKVPKAAHGSINLEHPTSSTKEILEAMMKLYDQIADPRLLVRRMTVTANHVVDEKQAQDTQYEQLDLFSFAKEYSQEQEQQKQKERAMQAVLEIKKKFGKNAVLKGVNLEEGATARERNAQIGGHKA